MQYEKGPDHKDDNDRGIEMPAVFVDLSVSDADAELLRWTRFQAFVGVMLPLDFRRQDELRDLLLDSLRGRSPVVEFADGDLCVGFDVSTLGDRDRMRCDLVGQEIASFLDVGYDQLFGCGVSASGNPAWLAYISERSPVAQNELGHI